MFEQNERLTRLTTIIERLLDVLTCHRAIYTGLAACHGSGYFITQKPELYGPMALLYVILALRG